MKLGLLQLPAGISGDMFLGVLVDAGASLEVMQRAVQAVGGDRITFARREVLRAGLRGLKVDVLLDGSVLHEAGGPVTGEEAPETGPPHHHHEHAHTSYREISGLIENAALDPRVRDRVQAVFRRLAEVEGAMHGIEPGEVHFHEVGSWDAIADIVGAVAGLVDLGLDALYHGVVALGGGAVCAAHGTLPVPAPATLRLLEGRRCSFQEGVGELTTPTGAALLAELALPVPETLAWTPGLTGYGAGTRDPGGFPNLARLTLGESLADARPGIPEVAVVEASLDDSTPEDGGHLLHRMLEAGALDATLSPLIMKKGRPGFLVRLVVPATEGERFAELLVRESTSLGARWRLERRVELPRRVDRVALPDGEVRVKVAILPDGSERPHVEFDDLQQIARARGIPMASLRREVEQLWEANR